MRLLLDTNIALWITTNGGFHRRHAAADQMQADAVFVSAATIWEIVIKVAIGKLDVDMDDLSMSFTASGCNRLAVTWEHGCGRSQDCRSPSRTPLIAFWSRSHQWSPSNW